MAGAASMLTPLPETVSRSLVRGEKLIPLTARLSVSKSFLTSGMELLKYDSCPEDDFYVTVTKLDKIYYHKNERLISE